MKISFAIGPRERNIAPPETFDISYDHRGHICSVIVYGDISKPQILIVPPTPSPAISISRYWFFMNISWSNPNGFEFNQYSDPEITASINSTPLNSNVGKLRGSDQIKINNGLLTITFKADVDQADVDQADLDGNKPKDFLETCSKFGIRVTDINELRILGKLNCPRSQFYNVNFTDSDMEDSDFNGSKFTNVQFTNSNLDGAIFTNSIFSQVEFSGETKLKKSVFDNCKVAYDRLRIENDETLVFTNCDLTESTFVRAIISSKLENSNLSSANFSEAKLVASKFYNCTLDKTIFTKSIFAAYEIKSNNAKKPNTSVVSLITCCIGPKPELATKREDIQKGTIINCKFDSAAMNFIDLSNNQIENTDFEAANLSKSKLYNCEFLGTEFTGKTLKSANLSDADISCSKFESCNLNEVDLTRVRMIGTKVEKCDFVRSSFYCAKLRSSGFVKSDLTGVDLRNADLTMVNFDECLLHGANFHQTQRGGINLNINPCDKKEFPKFANNQEDKDKINMNSSCFIDFVEWSPDKDGDIQINTNDFLMIVLGMTSPVAVLSQLSKDNPLFISNIFSQPTAVANAKSAGHDLNDASVNIERDANESDIKGGSIETGFSVISDQNEEEIRDNVDTNYEESYSKDEQQ